MSATYDHANGGFSFGEGPKFYEFPALEFALAAGFYGHSDFTRMATETLRKMARGGVYDQLGGGFHRYSTDQSWQVPHFEKMSYDQALALSAYSHAYQVSGDPEFKQTALSVANYVENTLLDPSTRPFTPLRTPTPSPAMTARTIRGRRRKSPCCSNPRNSAPPRCTTDWIKSPLRLPTDGWSCAARWISRRSPRN